MCWLRYLHLGTHVCMCAYTYVYMYSYVFVRVCVWLQEYALCCLRFQHVCEPTYAYVYTHICIHIYVNNMHTCIYMQYLLYTHAWVFVCVRGCKSEHVITRCARIYPYTCMYICAHVSMCVCVFVCIVPIYIWVHSSNVYLGTSYTTFQCPNLYMLEFEEKNLLHL